MRLKHRIAAIIFVLELVVLLAVAGTLVLQTHERFEELAVVTEKVHVGHLANLSRGALLTEDYAELQTFIEEAIREPRIDGVVVVDVFGTVVATTLPLLQGAPFDGFRALSTYEHERQLVVRGYGQVLGTVHARFTTAPFLETLHQVVVRTLWVAVAGVVVSGIVAWALGSWLATRLSYLADASATVAAGGAFEMPPLEGASPEMRRLAHSIGTMVDRLQAHAHELERARDALVVPTEAMAQGFAIWDAGDRLTLCNSRLAEIVGVPPERLSLGLSFDAYREEITARLARDVLPMALRCRRRSAQERGRTAYDLAFASGRTVHVDEAITRDGGIVGIYTDVTDRRRHERRLDLVTSCVLDGLLLVDRRGRLLHANPAAERMLGRIGDELCAVNLELLLATEPPWQAMLAAPGNGQMLVEGEAVRADGTSLPVELVVVHAGEDEPDLFFVGLRDIRARKQAEAELRFAATHDALTGVLNHGAMQARVIDAVERARAEGTSAGFLFVDLDGFKLVNDTCGHAAGDALLVEVARRLCAAGGDDALVGRLGGDEFGILVGAGSDVRSAAVLADRVLASLREPFGTNDRPTEIGASIGIALYPDHAADAGELLRAADMALYEAKHGGGLRWRVFRRHEAARLRHRITVVQRLDRALEHGEFHLAYQPQYVLATGRLIGFEALLRWTSGMFGAMPPDVFIPIAEETGRIRELGYWVLRQAVDDLATLRAEGDSDIRVAVNVSPRQLADPGFAKKALDIIDGHGSRVALELTERVLIDGVGRSRRQLDALSDAGLPLVLDDFGTGYSSLNHLRRFKISEVKIDRSFVADILVDPNDAHLVRALITLCRDLGITATAEGVETAAQFDWLRHAGCTTGQGYLFAKPMPIADARALIGSDARARCQAVG